MEKKLFLTTTYMHYYGDRKEKKVAAVPHHGGLIQQLPELLFFSFSEYFYMLFEQLFLLMPFQQGSRFPAMIFAQNAPCIGPGDISRLHLFTRTKHTAHSQNKHLCYDICTYKYSMLCGNKCRA